MTQNKDFWVKQTCQSVTFADQETKTSGYIECYLLRTDWFKEERSVGEQLIMLIIARPIWFALLRARGDKMKVEEVRYRSNSKRVLERLSNDG